MSNAVPLSAVLALVFNAFAWGVSWWPFRQLEANGLHPLWATVAIFVICAGVIRLARPGAFTHLRRTPRLWVLMLAAGTTNAAFNWGVVIGDVVRVVLLFYLMPLWALLLARVLLGERLTPLALLRVALALAGAAIVLWPAPGATTAGLRLGLPELLGLIGGLSFALNNVMLRRCADEPEASRAMAMFLGGALVAGAVALLLGLPALAGAMPGGAVPLPLSPQPVWALGLVAMAAWFLLSNLSLQYGAARLPANVTAVVMLTEILFATGTAIALGGGQLTAGVLLGGALILAAAGLSTLERPAAPPASEPLPAKG
jgi:drug/metabolite transporter (DMT)-like permease